MNFLLDQKVRLVSRTGKRQVFFHPVIFPNFANKNHIYIISKKGFLKWRGSNNFSRKYTSLPINLELVKSFWSLNWEKQLWDQKFQKGDFSLQFFASSIPKLPFFSPPLKKMYIPHPEKMQLIIWIIITWDKQSSTFL